MGQIPGGGQHMLPIAELAALLQRPPDSRDDAWMIRFSQVALDTGLIVADPPMHRGPDGFDYYTMRFPQPDDVGGWQTLRAVLPWCTDNGTGCTILDRGRPAFVFQYAHLWALREDNMMYRPEQLRPDSGEPSDQILTVGPSETFLPAYVRSVLRDYLRRAGVEQPEVVLVVHPGESPSRGMGFNLYPNSFDTREAYDDVIESLRWYIRHDVGVVNDATDLPGMVPL